MHSATSPAVFISYAHEDRAVAHELAFGLQKRGCTVWIDNGELKVGDSLVERLADGIALVDFVIAIVSKYSVDSPWCRKELSLAMTQEIDLEGRFGVRRVLPLRVGRVEMPPLLRDKLYLDVSRKKPGDLIPRLWEDIAGLAAGASSLQPPPEKSDAEASYERGVRLYDKGEFAAASRHLHDASQESHHAAALLLGEILWDRREAKKAADEWQFAAGSSEQELASSAVVQYGRMLAACEFDSESGLSGPWGASLGGRDRGEAEELWLSAAESEQRDAAWAWLGLGRLREDPLRDATPDVVGAEQAFDRAARCGHSESHAYALFKLGRAHWTLGKIDEAIAVFTVGATTGDSDWAPWCAFDLGRICWSRHEDEEAGRWWYQAATAGHPRISKSAQEAIDDPSSIWRSR